MLLNQDIFFLFCIKSLVLQFFFFFTVSGLLKRHIIYNYCVNYDCTTFLVWTLNKIFAFYYCAVFFNKVVYVPYFENCCEKLLFTYISYVLSIIYL